MHVVATAGHVDHGKSTLIRALTGTDPDRWPEEHRRELTIDLGYAQATLPSGRSVSFVDVPGHERFLGNMLMGLGPARVVCFVVAADEGWQQQSSDHRDALGAFGIEHGLIVVTRADLADSRIPTVADEARHHLAATGLADAPAVAVSAVTGEGLDEARAALDAVLAATPVPAPQAPIRLWLDRSFSVAGAGTIVTGTLTAGTIRRGDRLELVGAHKSGTVVVRGLQTHGVDAQQVGPVSRVALNLRGVDSQEIGRGDALATVDAWWSTDTIDVRRRTGTACTEAPTDVVVHHGTAAVSARFRAFDADHGRLTLSRRLPLAIGDAVALRDTGSRAVIGGVAVLDVDPPELHRRGDGVRRAAALAGYSATGDLAAEVGRRGAVSAARLAKFGYTVPDDLPDRPQGRVRRFKDMLVDPALFDRWTTTLADEAMAAAERDPVSPGITRGAAADMLGLPAPSLIDAVVTAAGLVQAAGTIMPPGADATLGEAEPAIAELRRRLLQHPFRAPDADELDQLGLLPKTIAAAARQGRILRLDGDIVLLPESPALAMRELVTLDAPFTASAARHAWGTTRRTAIPLLEHLDAKGWTRRIDGSYREIVR